MKFSKHYLATPFLLIFLVATGAVYGQPDLMRQKSIRLDIGASYVAVKDFSASPLLYTGTGIKVGGAYVWRRSTTVENEFSINYRGGVITNTTPGLSGFTVYHATFRYRRLRAVTARGNFKVGGTTAIFARVRVHDFYDNNFLSYDIGWNVGVAASYTKEQLFTDKLTFSFYLNLPVAAYYVRPVYGFNFPEAFLTEENYNQRLDGVYASLLTSGEIVSFNKYLELNTEATLSYRFAPKYQVQLRYQWNYAQFKSLESSYFGEQALLLSLVRHL